MHMATLPHMALALISFIHWMTEYKDEPKVLCSAAMKNSDDHHDNVSDSPSDQKVEALDLLEESWFFENLFNRRSNKMLRCYSDPCSSSNFAQDVVLAKDSCVQTSSSAKTLIRAPSLPPCIGRDEKIQERKNNGGRMRKLNRQLSLQPSMRSCAVKTQENIQEKIKTDHRKSKLIGESSRCNLLRTPSLPTSLEEKELTDQDNDSDIRMSRLIRQALANSTVPPRHSPKAMAQRYCRPPRNIEVETINNNNTNWNIQEMRHRHPNQKTLQKCHSDTVAFEELQGFKDLGFTFDKEELQENKTEELKQEKVRRGYWSEAWLAQSRGPPIPNCVSKNSAEDMKAQLKFWARAVATNVRQEC